MAASVRVLDVRVDAYDPEEALGELMARARTRLATRVMFVNAHCLNVASGDPAYREALRNADVVLADGSGLLLASRLLGLPVRHNLNGTDLVPRLLEAAAAEGLSVYFLGGEPGIAARAAEVAGRRWPGIVIAGSSHGYLTLDDEAAVLDEIARLRPHVLLVAMGVPRQELWMDRTAAVLPPSLTLGVGALFDFMAGRFPRAPRWMRLVGIEWMYRLYLEPGRLWRRYLIGNVAFLGRVLVDARSARGTHDPRPDRP
jgi:N-acetylglucosaminyldiphosphoundecaprenol N-acetyl-beta-D-mannosaminyltransferase